MPVLRIHPAPVPHPELVAHVRKYLPKRDSQWAWNLINRTGGRDSWPPAVIRLVEAQAEQEASDER